MIKLPPFSERAVKGTLMHELNHQYGAKDHYHEIIDEDTPNERCRGGDRCSDCGSNARPNTCIMNKSDIDITISTIICMACKSEIFAHLDEHH